MKKLILLTACLSLLGCSASDTANASCTSRCKFTKDLSSNQFFYVSGVSIDCDTKTINDDTLEKLQVTQQAKVYFCGCD